VLRELLSSDISCVAGCARSFALGFPKTGKMIHRFGGLAIAHFWLAELHSSSVASEITVVNRRVLCLEIDWKLGSWKTVKKPQLAHLSIDRSAL